MKKLFVFSLVFSLVGSSCHYLHEERVRGNGAIKTENRIVTEFDKVSVSGNIDIYVKLDSARAARVEADENLMEYIEVNTESGRLVIRPRKGYNLKGTRDIKVYVTAPSFSEFDASGACHIFSENMIRGHDLVNISLSGASDIKMDIEAPRITTELSGAGTIQLKGQTKDFSVDGSGSVSVKCMELMAENVDIDISGAGNAAVFASVKLDVHVSGAGNVVYKGNAVVSKHISGAGSVKKVE